LLRIIFFYSGINGCCSDFDFIVGELIPTPTTTTTEFNFINNNYYYYRCTIRLYIIWSIVLTDCEINGLGVIIGPIVPG
jgi:hypothetical protein